MSSLKFVKTMPGDQDYDLFDNLPQKLYSKDSHRFRLGHEPVLTHLEGCYLLLNNSNPVARFSFYENPDLLYSGQRTACLGSYECVSDMRIAHELLTYAKDLARSKGYSWLIGPMEGSTWNSYRFSLDNHHSNFFLEPYHHSYYNDQLKDYGFETIAEFYSKRDQSLSYDPQRLESFEKHFNDRGVSFRNLNINKIESELERLAKFSIEAYANNFLYTPITIKDFTEKYMRLEKIMDPKLVWIAEDKTGTIEAISFSLKDYYNPSGKSFIVKSIARRHASPFRGLGSLLVSKTVQSAIKLGYKSAIHAFMIKDNASMEISKKHDTVAYKEYNLYGLKL